MKVKLLGRGYETRFFYNPLSKAFREGIRKERILLYGNCNLKCAYCKREANFKDVNGNIINTKKVELQDIFNFINSIDPTTEMLRLSGGDPITMPFSLLREIVSYAKKRNIVTSVASNMSITEKVKFYTENIDYIAGDMKAPARYWEEVTGTPISVLHQTIQNWQLVFGSNAEFEMRIPIFPFTTFEDIENILFPFKDYFSQRKFLLVLRNYSPVSWLDWKPTPIETVLEMAKTISNKYNINVLARLRWKIRSIWFQPGKKPREVTPEGEIKEFSGP